MKIQFKSGVDIMSYGHNGGPSHIVITSNKESRGTDAAIYFHHGNILCIYAAGWPLKGSIMEINFIEPVDNKEAILDCIQKAKWYKETFDHRLSEKERIDIVKNFIKTLKQTVDEFI